MFESLIIEEEAKATNASVESVKQLYYSKDEGYATVRLALHGLRRQLKEYFGNGPALAYAELAASIYVYTLSAGLVAKYYSLSADIEDYEIVGIRAEQALNGWLQFSEEQTRRNLAALIEQGIDPSACAQLYDVGRLLKSRDLDGKLQAMDMFWNANLRAEVLRYLIAKKALAAGK